MKTVSKILIFLNNIFVNGKQLRKAELSDSIHSTLENQVKLVSSFQDFPKDTTDTD